MLLAHFRLAETDNPRFDPDNFDHEEAIHRILQVTNQALTYARRRLAITSGFSGDGEMPFLLPYVTDFQIEQGLDSADAWGEQYEWGQGVHIGLVFEGKATGPLYATEGQPGVRRDDFATLPLEFFARGVQHHLKPDLLPFELSRTYSVTDWSFYERESQGLVLPA